MRRSSVNGVIEATEGVKRSRDVCFFVFIRLSWLFHLLLFSRRAIYKPSVDSLLVRVIPLPYYQFSCWEMLFFALGVSTGTKFIFKYLDTEYRGKI